MKEKIEKFLGGEPEHILMAKEMAHSIFKQTSDKHAPMVEHIKDTLYKLHEKEADNIRNI